MEVLKAQQRIDMQRGDRLRVALGDLLDSIPPRVESMTNGAFAPRSKTDRRVVLGRDLRRGPRSTPRRP